MLAVSVDRMGEECWLCPFIVCNKINGGTHKNACSKEPLKESSNQVTDPAPLQNNLSTEDHDVEKLCKLSNILNNWQGTVLDKKNAERRARRESRRGSCRVKFEEMDDGSDRMSVCKFDPEEAPKAITCPSHQSEDHNDIPWDEEEDYEELPWWEYPDLDEDDEVTALCRKILTASRANNDTLLKGNDSLSHIVNDEEKEDIRVARIEATVTKAALKLLNKGLYRRQTSIDSSCHSTRTDLSE